MKLGVFAQVYVESDVEFPFSIRFQHCFPRAVGALVKPSATFVKKYGKGWELGFYMSAKRCLRDNEIRGPSVSKKSKDVVYTVFLPFDVIMRDQDPLRCALSFLLKGVCQVLEMLDIDTARLVKEQGSLIERICADPRTLEQPSWDELEDQPTGYVVVEEFVAKARRSVRGRKKGALENPERGTP